MNSNVTAIPKAMLKAMSKLTVVKAIVATINKRHETAGAMCQRGVSSRVARSLKLGRMALLATVLANLLFSHWSFAQDDGTVINLSDAIVGSQENPKVMYIVPWKPAEDTTILYLPLDPKAMENLFGHVERVEHQRQVKYIEQLDELQ